MIPQKLPVDLSVSSINLFKKCPERWRRRYIMGEYEPSGGAATLGSSIHAAEGAHFQQVADGVADTGGWKVLTGEEHEQFGLDTHDVVDLFSDEWEERLGREEVVWTPGEKPGVLKDEGVRVLEHYHESVAPQVRPASVERKFTLRFPGAEWTFRGYIDIEDARDHIIDLKIKKRRMSKEDARLDLQPSAILAARRLEGKPATRFEYHQLIRPTTRTAAQADVLGTERSAQQCDLFLNRVANIAREIAWRVENDIWEGAIAGSWWCSAKWCGFFPTCKFVK